MNIPQNLFDLLQERTHAVTTLATLILLSYGKLLQTIIASFSFAILNYPNGSQKMVWLPDATVEYLRGKHIVLFAVAILILLAGVIYTSLLFFFLAVASSLSRQKCIQVDEVSETMSFH